MGLARQSAIDTVAVSEPELAGAFSAWRERLVRRTGARDGRAKRHAPKPSPYINV
jgi:hypothetical protein